MQHGYFSIAVGRNAGRHGDVAADDALGFS